MARLAAARRRRRAAAGADHVQHHRREPPDRMGGRLAAGLRGLAAGAHWQRCARPAPARRLRRGHGRALPGTPRRHRRQRGCVEPDAGLPVAPDDDLARARSRHLGKPGGTAPLHFQQDHGLGRLRPRRQVRPRLRHEGTGRALERGGARDPRRCLPPGLRCRAGQLRAVLRLEVARRQPAADPHHRLPAARRPAHPG